LEADYVTMVEGRPIMPKLIHAAVAVSLRQLSYS